MFDVMRLIPRPNRWPYLESLLCTPLWTHQKLAFYLFLLYFLYLGPKTNNFISNNLEKYISRTWMKEGIVLDLVGCVMHYPCELTWWSLAALCREWRNSMFAGVAVKKILSALIISLKLCNAFNQNHFETRYHTFFKLFDNWTILNAKNTSIEAHYTVHECLNLHIISRLIWIWGTLIKWIQKIRCVLNNYCELNPNT